MKDVQKLTHEAIQSITVDAWKSCTNHVLSIENRLCEAEGIVEAIQPVIISFRVMRVLRKVTLFHFRVMTVLRKATLMNPHQALI